MKGEHHGFFKKYFLDACKCHTKNRPRLQPIPQLLRRRFGKTNFAKASWFLVLLLHQDLL